MPKDACVGGALWEQYSRKVRARMDNPTHRGQVTEDEAKAIGCELIVVDWGAEACGDAVTLYWAVERKTDTIKIARFYSFGCGTAIASSDLMCEMCENKTIEEVLKINNIVVEAGLRDTPDVPAVPPQKMHCSVMAHDVLRKAVATYRGVPVETLDDAQIVCHCARVTVGLVKETIRLNNLTTVEQITQYTKAGAFCKSCIRPGGHEKKEHYLEDILRETRAEMAKERLAAAHKKGSAGVNEEFRKMNVIRKGNVIQAAIDEHVAPILEKDDGAADVVDVRDAGNGETKVYIQYTGACADCAARNTTTLEMIQSTLRREVDEGIVVIVQQDSI